MRTVTPDIPKRTSPAFAARLSGSSSLLSPWSLPLALVLVLSLLAGMLAYQAPPEGSVRVGWAGDWLFLTSSNSLSAEASAQGAFYPDELTPDSPTSRSRWTREMARLVLPNLGRGTALELTLLAQGWPGDVRDPPQRGTVAPADTPQPRITVRANGREVGSFVPTTEWQTYRIRIPAEARSSADLRLELEASATFRDTTRSVDPRPKGLRLAALSVSPPADTAMLLPPAWAAVGLLMLAALLLYALLIRLLRSAALGFVLTTLCIGATGAGLALARIWMGAALTLALWVLLLALLLAWQRPLLGGLRALLRRYSRGWALHYGLVLAALAWLAVVLVQGFVHMQQHGLNLGFFQTTFPDSLLGGLLGAGLLALLLVLGRDGLPRVADGIVGLIGGRRGAPVLLALLGGVWLGYEALIIAALPYVGHADYADNAVVARNLVAGRGWVVDYVTQFYHLYDGTTRPQETWPLLQPVWMAPFLALFGPHAWAAKIPNLLFNVLLLLLIYHVGTHLWDRRVGLLAALLTLTNHLFFTLTIYTTSDLGFVLLSMAAIFLMYRAVEAQQAEPAATPLHRRAALRYLAGSGVLAGLMMLQKPSGALIAVGIGLWYIFSTLRPNLASLRRLTLRFGLWALLALVVLSPYLARNMALFGAPVYSTESYDAWVLGYRGDSGDAWNDIYRIYAPELGGPGLPDRSWILRWGFDYTAAKFATQLDALRDYLMPAWDGQPALLVADDGRPFLFARDASKNLLTPLGAWLALIGVLAALRTRPRLLALLLLAFAPYTIFLLTYWRTNEERYFLMVMPWLALLAAWIIWSGYDKLAALGDRRWSPLALILVGVAVAGIVQPSWPRIATKVQTEPQQWAPDIAAYEWIEEHTAPDAVMMTRNPWQLNWHTGRPAVMIPNTNERELFFYLAEHYDADYIVFENLQRVKGEVTQIVGPLADARTAQPGAEIAGFELVYASPTPTERVLIYRFPELTASEPPGAPQAERTEPGGADG
jgi:4-amino-4-deoxy-L-arabinose transferase-like glycosyltransferase